jgi:CRISPR-associated exonuclease Cas4
MTHGRSQARCQPGRGRPADAGFQVPLSALEHYEYCPRQAGLILLEDGYVDNADTVRGTLLHRHVHEPGGETRDGVRTLWALPVWHDDLGLTGICDAVEFHDDGRIVPIEHKSGNYVPGGPADVQLAGQAVCLEAMFGTRIVAGAIFSAAGRRRHQVQITPSLRDRVAAVAAEVRALLQQDCLPPPVADRRCQRCSMNHVCIPRVLAGRRGYARAELGLFNPAAEAQGPWP